MISPREAWLEHRVNYLEDKHHGDSDVYSAITAFYGAFSSSQKPLEAEFSKVLFDNLWDLYAT